MVGFLLKIYSFEFRQNCCCYNLFCKQNYLQTLSKYIKYKYLSQQRLNNYPRWWKLSNPLDRFLVAGVSGFSFTTRLAHHGVGAVEQTQHQQGEPPPLVHLVPHHRLRLGVRRLRNLRGGSGDTAIVLHPIGAWHRGVFIVAPLAATGEALSRCGKLKANKRLTPHRYSRHGEVHLESKKKKKGKIEKRQSVLEFTGSRPLSLLFLSRCGRLSS